MNELDYPNPCNKEIIDFINWMIDTRRLEYNWEFIQGVLEKPQNFYEQYQEFKKEREKT